MRRWPRIMGGLLIAGAAIGAASALVARRRANRNQWEEYGSPRSTGTSTIGSSATGSSVGSTARSTVESGKQKVTSLAESAKERASDLMHGNQPGGASSTETAGRSEFGTREDLYGKAGSGSNNSRS